MKNHENCIKCVNCHWDYLDKANTSQRAISRFKLKSNVQTNIARNMISISL